MVQDGVGSIEKLGLPAAPEGTMPFGVAMDVVFFFVFVVVVAVVALDYFTMHRMVQQPR